MATEPVSEKLGIVTAYGYAKANGFTGTEQEFAELMGGYAEIAQGAKAYALEAEGYAKGTQDGQAAGAPYANNNASYYNQQAREALQNVTSTANAAAASARDASNYAANANTAKTDAQAAAQRAEAAANTIDNIEAAAQAAEEITALVDDVRDGVSTMAVLHDVDQTLDADHKARARANIGLGEAAVLHNVAQTLADGGAQARENIGFANAAVIHNATQTLDDTAKARVWENIGLKQGVLMLGGDQTLTDAQKTAVRNRIDSTKGAVRFDASQELTDEQKAMARANIGASAGAVLYDKAQNLEDSEKTQARQNIGVDDVVHYGQQSLTTEQKNQAKTNIGIVESVIRYDIDQTTGAGALTAEQQARARNNIGASAGAVRYDVLQQDLQETDKARARTNIGVSTAVIRYDEEQELDSTQKARALSNIGMGNVVENVVPVEGGVKVEYVNGTDSTIEIETGGLAFDGGRVDDNNRLHLTLNGTDIDDLFTPVTLPAGGGGGGAATGEASITRITDASVDCIYGDTQQIVFRFTATDSSGDAVGNGTGTWSVGGVVVSRNNVIYQGQNAFDISPYLTAGNNSVKLTVTVDTGGSSPISVSKSWTINAVNMYFTWNYDDTQVNVVAFTDRWTPYGEISKTTHTLLDGVALETSTTTRSGSQQSMTIPMQEHGTHTIERWLTATIGGTEKSTAHQYHEAIFIEDGNTTPVIAISMQSGTMNQYDTVQIPVVVYDPTSLTTDVELLVNGSVVGQWNDTDRSMHFWNYSPSQAGTHVLGVRCGTTVRSITMTVVAVQIDVQEVAGYSFKFKASDLSTNNSALNWESNGVNADYSENFDWINGGLHTETDDYGYLQQYFAIKAGTRMTINHFLFATDPKSNGMTFKMIYKVKNCRNYDAQIAHCFSGVGIQMYAHQAVFSSSGTTVTVPYGEDEYIELEFDVYPAPKLENDGNYRYMMAWADGVITSCRVYGTSDNFVQPNLTKEGIVLGSDDCDLWLYMVKAYPTIVDRDGHIDNFIMDAPNASEMIRRYNRNNILDESGAISYEKLIQQNPDCRVWLYDIPYLTNDKSDKVSGCEFHQFWGNGDRYYEMSGKGKMSVQGTSSVQYIRGAANTDINFSSLEDGYGNDLLTGGVKDDDYGGNYFFEDTENPGHAKVFTAAEAIEAAGVEAIANLGPEWVVVGRDASKNPTSYVKALGMKLNDNSCPISYSNTKVNFASCEQVNNMCNAAWYQRFNPYPSLTARDCMEFNMGVQFIKDSGTVPDSSHFVLWGDNKYHMYSIANMGNSKKNVHVFHDLSNPLEVCIEVNDNNAEQMRMINDDLSEEDWGGKKYFGMRYPDTKNPSQAIRDAWQRLVTWMATNNPQAATNEPLDTPETYGNYTFRGHDRAGTQVLRGTVVTQYAGTYTHDTFNRRMAKMLSECEDYMVMDSFMYHYVYLERHTMVDNVSKNNFWSSTDLVHWDLSKAYDMDTSDGNNNQGQMKFDYGNEWNDMFEAKTVFNGGDSVWFVFCANLYEAAREMFLNREAAGAWSATAYHNFLLSEQQKVPERCWVQCYWYDYLRTYEQGIESAWMTFLDGGQKTHQRKHFEFFEELYDSSKYRGTVSTSQNVNFRAYRVGSWGGNVTAAGGTPFYTSPNLNATTWGVIPEGAIITITNKTDDTWREVNYNNHTGFVQLTAIETVEPESKITLTMYNKMYIAISSGTTVGELVKAERGIPYTIDLPVAMDTGGSQIVIYTAPMIQAISGMEHLFPDTCAFSQATRLRELTIGSPVKGYQNTNLSDSLTLSQNTMLERLYVQNLPNANFNLELDHCPSLVYLDATGSGFTGYRFADGGLISTAIINEPSTLTLLNLAYLEDENFTIADTSSLSGLRIENTPEIDSLTLTNSAGALQIVRIMGIDWTLTSTALLDAMLDMQGYDEANGTIAQSVLSGAVYVPAITQRKLEAYNTAWPNLTVTYGSMTQQYPVHFYNADGTTIKDRRGNDYIQYIDRGSLAYDPVTAGEVATPRLDPDAQYFYSFEGWDGIRNSILQETNITATYSTSVRTYTVRWFAQAGDVRKTLTDVPYGSEVWYDDDPYVFPELTDEETTFKYKIFTGWDKSTGFITGDLDVYAQWDQAVLPTAHQVELKNMSVAQISGVAKTNMAASYWDPKDYTDITLGKDFNFSNVGSEVLAQDLYLDGTTLIDTHIKLFDADAPTFTLAVDFEFADTTTNATLVGCYNMYGNDGFRLAYNSNPYAYWGDRTLRVSYGMERAMIVFRHIKGSDNLYVASSNPGSNLWIDSFMAAELTRTRSTETDATLTFGGVFDYQGAYSYLARGWIHWAKIWYDSLGNRATWQLAQWPHEKIRMEYYGANLYALSGEPTARCAASFMSNSSLEITSYMNTTNTNVGGWYGSWLRRVVNDRFFDALPYSWQAMIKQVSVAATAGDMSRDIVRSDDKIFFPALAEVTTQTTEPYILESPSMTYRHPYFTTNEYRCKFNGIIRPEDSQYIENATDPTLMTGVYVVQEGDVWRPNYQYIYVPQEVADKHGYYGGRNISSTENLVAQGVQGGVWIRTREWWLRSPQVSNNSQFMYIRVWGDYGSTYGSYGLGVTPCFCI